MANPRVRPHLRFYLEDTGKHVSEYWHACHWHQDANPMQLMPVAVIGSQQFWTFEPCVLKTGAIVMPSCWFICDNVMHAVAWTLRPHGSGGQVTGWIVEEFNNVVIS
jgi:hypothetical protein